MKKIFYILASAIVALGAVACENDGLDNIAPEGKGETLSFTAEIDNTRIALDGLKTVWAEGDELVIKGYTFVCQNDGKTFKGEGEGINAAFSTDEELTVWYNEDLDSSKGLNGVSMKGVGKIVSGGEAKLTFSLQCALLKYTTTEEVKFEGTALSAPFTPASKDGVQYIPVKAGEGSISYSVGGVQCKSLVKNFETSKIYNLGYLGGMVSLSPGVWDGYGAWFAARFYNDTQAAAVNALTRAGEVDEAWVKMTDDNYDGVYECVVPGAYSKVIFCRMSDQATVEDFKDTTTIWNKVWNQSADLTIDNECYTVSAYGEDGKPSVGAWGEVPAAPVFGVVGSFQSPTTWDVAKPVVFVFEKDYWYVAKDIELYKNDEFKVVTGNSWDNPSYGKGEAGVLNVEEVTDLVVGGQNMKAAKNGKFYIYFNVKTHQIKYTCVEEYTDLKVNITIDNKANWSPLYITLQNGNTIVVNNETVTNNKFAVSGNYIGETLSYTLSNGSKTSEGNVSITKNGATINLEETIIKLKVQLNTANAKQWWGNTMKIHAWNTGTSFDTSWPGNTMTSEGNYTWSIIVPSELVGKTINFLVHNGNGWQSKDSQVTIKAEGNTVTGSSIGIN